MKIRVITVLIGCGALFGGWLIYQQFVRTNDPHVNKQIEIQAARDKDTSKCKEIQGPSYTFGPTDGQITLSESEARDECAQNIKDGIIPPESGG